MDHRIALKNNTSLRLLNDKGEAIHFVIKEEIGRGGSCIVYEASRKTDTGDISLYRIKEFYPYEYRIERDKNNQLLPGAQDEEAFHQKKEQFRLDFSRTNRLFYSGENYASMTNQLDIFEQNNTSYVLSAYSSKKTLATYRPESVKECVNIVRQAAYILGNIHRQGFLYLDMKPDNVLITDGLQKQIRLFDFDSLISMEDIKCSRTAADRTVRLSYSKGFAAIELQTSKISRLGPHTDVYGVGALLFYLLFGRTPDAPDCEGDAVYDFAQMRYGCDKCDDRLFIALTEFFHEAIAVYYADRYKNMQEVMERLEIIEKYADVTIPRIYSTKTGRPGHLFGREKEYAKLDALLKNYDNNPIYITGMGGIGKSTFIRGYLADRHFDTALYVYYKDSIEATISDDNNIEINTMKQGEADRSEVRYFERKLQKIKELVRGTDSILVIDNFTTNTFGSRTGNDASDLRTLLAPDWKVVFLTRSRPVYQNAHEMNMQAISDASALKKLFEANLGRPISVDEASDFDKIIKHAEGHTLTIELMAKQIAASHITISAAAALTDMRGFSSIAPEKVDYEKDNDPGRDTIGNIIDILFETGELSEEKKILLKTASLLGDGGMDIAWFARIMGLSSMDDINELIRDGWLMISGNAISGDVISGDAISGDVMSGDVISMHRVIREAVRRWGWQEHYVEAAEQFLKYFYVELKDKSSAEIRKNAYILSQSEDIIRECKRDGAITENDIYRNLLYETVLNTPSYREEYILAEAEAIFPDFEKNPVTIMRLYEKALLIHTDNKRFDEAEKLLRQAEKAAGRAADNMVYAIYYNMLSEYYDDCLDGFYAAETHSQRRLLGKLLDTIDITLYYSKYSISYDTEHLYAKNILAKAVILMRSGKGSIKEIRRLIREAKDVIMEYTSECDDVRLHFCLICGWYAALIEEDETMTDLFVDTARKLSETIYPTDIQKIECVIIPCANMYYELSCRDKSLKLLYEGVQLCEKYPNTDSYIRVNAELNEHIAFVKSN